ncbi:uncharacterized protein LOC127852631 [Dreissena polymorpha]|uniref:uncharacterized protein LOC127852631 n=1 Tax=Dreissena polymorpha TaxID=45954 RepID=UPI002263AF53|nr:uncharacterized protein LOC127852631 [Dreissena polymorpha]
MKRQIPFQIRVILILVVCLNNGECLTCLVNGKPTLYNPDNQLCCKGLYPRVQNGFKMKCCNGTVYPGHSHQCCDDNVYNQSKTQFCCNNVMHDNENQNLALHFRLEGIEERKRDRVWLHITVTLSTKSTLISIHGVQAPHRSGHAVICAHYPHRKHLQLAAIL